MRMKLVALTMILFTGAISAYAVEGNDNSACPSGEVISCFTDNGCFCAKENPDVEPDPGVASPGCDDENDDGTCD